MKTLKIGTHTVTMYDSIEDLPVVRFHKYQKMLMVDAGLGSDLTAFDTHIEKARRFILTGDKKNAEQELQNLRMSVFFVTQEMSPRHLAFAVLVVSIDGRICDDLSDDGLRNVVQAFSDVPVKDLVSALTEAKKKIDGELAVYFPSRFDNGTAKEFYDLVLRRTKLILQELSEGRNPDERPEIAKLDDDIALFFKPQNFAGKESAEIQFDRQFENVCLMISESVQRDAKSMTVLEYYNAFEYIEERARKNKQKQAKFKR